jgi:hypothetical protein
MYIDLCQHALSAHISVLISALPTATVHSILFTTRPYKGNRARTLSRQVRMRFVYTRAYLCTTCHWQPYPTMQPKKTYVNNETTPVCPQSNMRNYVQNRNSKKNIDIRFVFERSRSLYIHGKTTRTANHAHGRHPRPYGTAPCAFSHS